MAVPPTSLPPTWRSIPTQSAYPGQTLRINLRNYQTRQDATITLRGTPPSWVTLNISGLTKELVIAAPSSLTGGQSYTIQLRASAFASSTQTTENRDISFTLNISTPVRPAFTPTAQSLTAGVPFSVDVNTFRTAGEPTPSYALRGSPPSWLELNGSTLSGTPPVGDYTSPTNRVNVTVRATNVAGFRDFTVTLNIARAVGPGIVSIPNQYAVQGDVFTLDLSTYIAGTPTPTIVQTGLPQWLQVNGLTLTGTPAGFTANTTQTVTLTIQNPVGSVSHNFTIYVRVFSDTFTEPDTGSPITVGHSNITALAATEDRLYYASSGQVGRVFATSLTALRNPLKPSLSVLPTMVARLTFMGLL